MYKKRKISHFVSKNNQLHKLLTYFFIICILKLHFENLKEFLMFLLSFIRNRIIKNRLKKNLAKYQSLLSDPRTYNGMLSKVKDMLSEIFGYEQKEIISGNSIQFFDIAVKINKKFIIFNFLFYFISFFTFSL